MSKIITRWQSRFELCSTNTSWSCSPLIYFLVIWQVFFSLSKHGDVTSFHGGRQQANDGKFIEMQCCQDNALWNLSYLHIHHQILCTCNFRNWLKNGENREIYSPTCEYLAALINSCFDQLKCQNERLAVLRASIVFLLTLSRVPLVSFVPRGKEVPLTSGREASDPEKFWLTEVWKYLTFG